MAVNYRTKNDLKSEAGLADLLALFQHLPGYRLTLETLAISPLAATKATLGISAELPIGQPEHLNLEKV